METKVCSKCGLEKSEDQFYRRGNKSHNACRDCFKASYSSPTNTRTAKDNSANFEAVGAIIVRLESRIRLTCAKYASDPMQADDIFGYVCEKLLTDLDPKASDNSIISIVNYRARDFLRKDHTYSFYVGSENEISNTPDDDDCGDVFEYYEAVSQNPEDLMIEREQAEQIEKVVSLMNPEYRQIVGMLMVGESKADISREIGVTRAAITQKVQKAAIYMEAVKAYC